MKARKKALVQIAVLGVRVTSAIIAGAQAGQSTSFES